MEQGRSWVEGRKSTARLAVPPARSGALALLASGAEARPLYKAGVRAPLPLFRWAHPGLEARGFRGRGSGEVNLPAAGRLAATRGARFGNWLFGEVLSELPAVASIN